MAAYGLHQHARLADRYGTQGMMEAHEQAPVLRDRLPSEFMQHRFRHRLVGVVVEGRQVAMHGMRLGAGAAEEQRNAADCPPDARDVNAPLGTAIALLQSL